MTKFFGIAHPREVALPRFLGIRRHFSILAYALAHKIFQVTIPSTFVTERRQRVIPTQLLQTMGATLKASKTEFPSSLVGSDR